MTAYAAADWNCTDANHIMGAAIDALYDPLYLKERQAAHQQEHAQQRDAISRFLPPELRDALALDMEVPPDAGGFTE